MYEFESAEEGCFMANAFLRTSLELGKFADLGIRPCPTKKEAGINSGIGPNPQRPLFSCFRILLYPFYNITTTMYLVTERTTRTPYHQPYHRRLLKFREEKLRRAGRQKYPSNITVYPSNIVVEPQY